MNRSDYSSKWRGCQASDCSLTTCFNVCKCETTRHFYGDLWTISSSDCGDKKLIFVLFVVTKAWWFCRPKPEPKTQHDLTYPWFAETYSANIYFRFGLFTTRVLNKLNCWPRDGTKSLQIIMGKQRLYKILQQIIHYLLSLTSEQITSASGWISLRVCPLGKSNGCTFNTGWDYSVWTKLVGWPTDGHCNN